LSKAFRESAEQALQERLQIQVYSLLSVAKLNNTGELIMPSSLHEPRFTEPGSGPFTVLFSKPEKKLVLAFTFSNWTGCYLLPPELSAGNFGICAR